MIHCCACEQSIGFKFIVSALLELFVFVRLVLTEWMFLPHFQEKQEKNCM